MSVNTFGKAAVHCHYHLDGIAGYCPFEHRLEEIVVNKPFREPYCILNEAALKVSNTAKWVFIGFLGTWICRPENAEYFKSSFGGKIIKIVPITKRDPEGKNAYNGFVHALVEDPEEFIMMYSSRIVIDKTGAWHAETQEQSQKLKEYFIRLREESKEARPLSYPEVSSRPVIIGITILNGAGCLERGAKEDSGRAFIERLET